jgi:hypothetical protein
MSTFLPRRGPVGWVSDPSWIVGTAPLPLNRPAAAAIFLVSLILAAMAPAQGPIRLRDVTAETGIHFRHEDGSTGRRWIVETVASGLATFDYDGNGFIDILFLTGGPLEGKKVERPPTNALYRNRGNFRFTDVTRQAGLAVPEYGMGVAVADCDNDGWPDVYLSDFGPNVLFRNVGDGSFANVTQAAGVGLPGKDSVGAGTAFLDMDGDGDLDLFVAHYLRFSYETHPHPTYLGHHVYPGPLEFTPVPADLFRNNGDGTFADVSRQSGVGATPSTGMGVVCADYDNDGATDVFVANDVMPNFLWHNDGRGNFEEVGLLAGIAYDVAGTPHANMGVECADYDNDGRLDFLITAFHRELATLYRNMGKGAFEDATRRTGAGEGSYNQVKWGCGFVDFDNDGYKDIFIACGNLYDNIDQWDRTTSYRAHNTLLRNLGNGRFADVSRECGLHEVPKQVGRGAAFDDLDNDGRVDVVVLNSRSAPTILRNESDTGNHWLQIRLSGVKTNRDGVGARVRVVAGDLTQIDEVHSGRGYQSHWGSRLHFGLGKRDRVDRIEVRWIGGGVEVLENVSVDRLLTITEGAEPEDQRHALGLAENLACGLAVAGEKSLGLEAGKFMAAYADNRAAGNELALEASPVAAAGVDQVMNSLVQSPCKMDQSESRKPVSARVLDGLISEMKVVDDRVDRARDQTAAPAEHEGLQVEPQVRTGLVAECLKQTHGFFPGNVVGRHAVERKRTDDVAETDQLAPRVNGLRHVVAAGRKHDRPVRRQEAAVGLELAKELHDFPVFLGRAAQIAGRLPGDVPAVKRGMMAEYLVQFAGHPLVPLQRGGRILAPDIPSDSQKDLHPKPVGLCKHRLDRIDSSQGCPAGEELGGIIRLALVTITIDLVVARFAGEVVKHAFHDDHVHADLVHRPDHFCPLPIG